MFSQSVSLQKKATISVFENWNQEKETLIQYFDAWITKSNKDLKKLQLGVKLDILKNLAPHISDAR